MPQILHLIDGSSPQASPAALALIAATTRHVRGFDHHVLLLGGAQLRRNAELAGLRQAQCVNVPRQRAMRGILAINRAVGGRTVDLVHCWSVGAGAMSDRLFTRTPQVWSLLHPPGRRGIAAIARRQRRSRGPRTVTVLNEAARDELVAAGVGDVAHVPPAIETELLDARRRESLRGRWFLDTPETRVLALLSDPPVAADARKANLGLGLAHESLRAALGHPPAMRLLMHPDQLHRLSAYRLLVNYGVAELIVQESGVAAPWQIAPGCDAALIPAEHAGGLATCWAMAAGLAIVAETPSHADAWLRNEDNALLADRDQPKRLAHRLHQLIHDPALARRIGEQARRDAEGHFAPNRYADRISELYRSLLAAG